MKLELSYPLKLSQEAALFGVELPSTLRLDSTAAIRQLAAQLPRDYPSSAFGLEDVVEALPTPILGGLFAKQEPVGVSPNGIAHTFTIPVDTTVTMAMAGADRLLGDPNVRNVDRIISNTKAMAALGDLGCQRALCTLDAVEKIRKKRKVPVGKKVISHTGYLDTARLTGRVNRDQVDNMATATFGGAVRASVKVNPAMFQARALPSVKAPAKPAVKIAAPIKVAPKPAVKAVAKPVAKVAPKPAVKVAAKPAAKTVALPGIKLSVPVASSALRPAVKVTAGTLLKPQATRSDGVVPGALLKTPAAVTVKPAASAIAKAGQVFSAALKKVAPTPAKAPAVAKPAAGNPIWAASAAAQAAAKPAAAKPGLFLDVVSLAKPPAVNPALAASAAAQAAAKGLIKPVPSAVPPKAAARPFVMLDVLKPTGKTVSTAQKDLAAKKKAADAEAAKKKADAKKKKAEAQKAADAAAKIKKDAEKKAAEAKAASDEAAQRASEAQGSSAPYDDGSSQAAVQSAKAAEEAQMAAAEQLEAAEQAQAYADQTAMEAEAALTEARTIAANTEAQLAAMATGPVVTKKSWWDKLKDLIGID